MDQNNELQLPIDLIETITDDKLRNNVTLDLSQRITAPVGDIKEIMDHANTILSSTYRFNNATSFKDISSRLTKEKLNTESKVITVAATDSAVSTEIKPDEDYVGLSSVEVNVKPLQNLIVPRIIPENFKYIPDDSAELETIYLKSTNATSSTTIGITITTDNPTEYSGLNKVTITDIGILQNQKFTVSKEHLISSNTFKLVFADDEHFGTSDVDITVPLIKNKRFSVNKNTIGRTYVPAEGDLALDGTTLTDTAPAIGFESVTLDADIAPGVTAAKLKELAASQGGTIISPGGTALGYESVEIPKLETLKATELEAALLSTSTSLDPDSFGYSEVQLPKLTTIKVDNSTLTNFIYSTSTTYEVLDLAKGVELTCSTFSSYTVSSTYVSTVQAQGATEIRILRTSEGISVQGIVGDSAVETTTTDDSNVLNKVVIQLPAQAKSINPVIVHRGDSNVYINSSSGNFFNFISNVTDIPTYVGTDADLVFEVWSSSSGGVYLIQYDDQATSWSGYAYAYDPVHSIDNLYHSMIVTISNGSIIVKPGYDGIVLSTNSWNSTNCKILKASTAV